MSGAQVVRSLAPYRVPSGPTPRRGVPRAAALAGAVLVLPACGGGPSTPGEEVARPAPRWSEEVRLGDWLPVSRPNPPVLGADGDGNVFAVWERREEETLFIVAARFDRAEGWSAPLDIGATMSSAPPGVRARVGFPQLAVARDGSALVAWIVADAEGSSLALSRYLPDADWSDVALPGEGAAAGRGASGARVASDGQSRALLAWTVGDDIWARDLRSDTGWGPATVVGTDLNTDYYYGVGVHAAAVHGDEFAVVLWFQGGNDGLRSGGGLRGTHYAAGRWSEPAWAIPLSRSYNGATLAGVDGSGTALLAWQGADPYLGVLPPAFKTGDAQGWSGSGAIAPWGYGLWDVALAPDGTRLALLSKREPADVDVSPLASRTFVAGLGWYDERPIAPGDTSPISGGRLAIGPDGTALAVWVAADSLRSAWRLPSGDWAEPLTITRQVCEGALQAVALDADGHATTLWATCGELRAARLAP